MKSRLNHAEEELSEVEDKITVVIQMEQWKLKKWRKSMRNRLIM